MAYGVSNINDLNLFGSYQTTNPNRNPEQYDQTWFSDMNSWRSFVSDAPSMGIEGAGFGIVSSSGTYGASNSTTTAPFGGVSGPYSAISVGTGSLNNSTDCGSFGTFANLLPGLPIPPAGLVTKYEFEARFATTATIHSDTVRGAYRLGFMDVNGMNTAGDSAIAGPHFRFMCNGTITDTRWMIYWINPSSGLNSTFDTGITVSASTVYRMYLAAEVNSAGVYTTTYDILNETTGYRVGGTASPSSSSHNTGEGYSTYGMGAAIISCKSAVTATNTSVPLYIDYMGVRVRRPLYRDILIGSI